MTAGFDNHRFMNNWFWNATEGRWYDPVTDKPVPGVLTEVGAAGAQALASGAGSTPSSYYRFFIPGTQSLNSGNAVDRSGKGAPARIAATTSLTDAEAWANAGWLSTVAGTSKFALIDGAKAQVDLQQNSLFFFVRLKKAVPAASESILGFAAVTGGATKRGWSLAALNTGIVAVRVYDGTSSYSQASITSNMSPLGADEHTWAFAIEGSTLLSYQWVDGVLAAGPTDLTVVGLNPATSSIIPTTPVDFTLGGNVMNAATTSAVAQFKGVHLLGLTRNLPANMNDLVYRLHTDSLTPLSAFELGA